MASKKKPPSFKEEIKKPWREGILVTNRIAAVLACVLIVETLLHAVFYYLEKVLHMHLLVWLEKSALSLLCLVLLLATVVFGIKHLQELIHALFGKKE